MNARPHIDPAMIGKVMGEPEASFRELSNRLGDYFGRDEIAPIPLITQPTAMLNPRAWPPCKHCGGNVHCEDYDPDTSAPLWGGEHIGRGK